MIKEKIEQILPYKAEIKTAILNLSGETLTEEMSTYADKIAAEDSDIVKALRGELTEIVIPENIKSDSMCHAFRDNNPIQKVTIPSTWTTIPVLMFYCNTTLTLLNSDTPNVINIPEGITSLSDYCFQGKNTSSYSLEGCSVILPSTLTNGGKDNFKYTGVRSIDLSRCPANLKLFPLNCKVVSLDYSHLTSVTTTSANELSNLPNLVSIVLPPNLTTLALSVLRSCNSLVSVDIPDSVTSIDLLAVGYQCSAMQYINFGNTRTTIPTRSGTGSSYSATLKLVIPDALFDLWKVATNWSNFANRMVKYSEFFS